MMCGQRHNFALKPRRGRQGRGELPSLGLTHLALLCVDLDMMVSLSMCRCWFVDALNYADRLLALVWIPSSLHAHRFRPSMEAPRQIHGQVQEREERRRPTGPTSFSYV